MSPRRILFALATLGTALALGWWLRTDRAGVAFDAQPVSVPTAAVRPKADPARASERVVEPAADATSAEPVSQSTDSDVDATASEPQPTSTPVHVHVLGLAPGERARVEALFWDSSQGRRAHTLHETDADGRVTLERPRGGVSVTAWTSSRATAQGYANVKDKELSIELRFVELATVVGTVVHAQTGQPIAGARVSSPGYSSARVALSDLQGRYALAIPGEGPFALRCEAEGYAYETCGVYARTGERWNAWLNAPGQDTAPVDLELGAPSVDFRLLPERTIRGVVYADGRAVRAAHVQAFGLFATRDDSADPERAQATTDESGAFELTGLHADVEHMLKFDAPGYAVARVCVAPAVEPRQDVGRISLEAPHELDVSVLDARGRPVEGLRVCLDRPVAIVGQPLGELGAEFPRTWSLLEDGRQSQSETTGPDGIARFDQLDASEARVRVLDGLFFELCDPVDLRVGERPQLELRIADGDEVAGSVFLDGRAVAGARVALHVYDWRWTTTAADGGFRFYGVKSSVQLELDARWTDARGREWRNAHSQRVDPQRPNVVVLVLEPKR